MTERNIIVIGGSAGGLEALKTLMKNLPPDLDAAIFCVMHVHPRSSGSIVQILGRVGPLPTLRASEGQPIALGRVYVAPADHHLQIGHNHVHLTHGPKEGLHRPSINVTFRSAAASYHDRVIGVLLSGMLDDGASGLWDIARQGGVTIVQDPEDALYPSMPLSALRDVPVNYVLPVEEIAPLLVRLVSGAEVKQVSHSALTTPSDDPHRFSGFTCPECRGPLYEHRTVPTEFRCRVGHIFPLETLIDEQAETQERKLYEAILALEEGADLAEYAAKTGDDAERNRSLQQAAQLRSHAAAIRKLAEANTTVG